jgi:hypothetical protein
MQLSTPSRWLVSCWEAGSRSCYPCLCNNSRRMANGGYAACILGCRRATIGRSATVDPNTRTNCRFATLCGLSPSAALPPVDALNPRSIFFYRAAGVPIPAAIHPSIWLDRLLNHPKKSGDKNEKKRHRGILHYPKPELVSTRERFVGQAPRAQPTNDRIRNQRDEPAALWEFPPTRNVSRNRGYQYQ